MSTATVDARSKPAAIRWARYTAKRLIHSLLVILGAFTVTFAIMYVLPSDPIAIMLGSKSGDAAAKTDPAAVAALNSEYGFDRPIAVQYVTQLGRMLTGDFGTSLRTGAPVSDALAQAIPSTVALSLAGLAVGLILGITIAATAARSRSARLQGILLALPPFGVAVPSFLLGLIAIQLFAFHWPIFPPLGNNGVKSLVLPAVTLGIGTAATIAQVLSRTFMHTWNQPFVDVARAKGASRTRVQFAHIFRAGLVPLLTISGMVVGNLFAGAVVIETVFSRRGVGLLTQASIADQDVPVIQAIVVLSAAAYVLVSLSVDLLYPLADPRMKSVLESGGQR